MGLILTLKEAADALGISAATLRSQIRNGAIAATKVGPVWTMTQDEVTRYRSQSLGRRFGRKP